jgi:mutator protein MutT
MEPEIIGAIIGGLFAIFATLLPTIVKWFQKRRQPAPSDPFPTPEGLSAVIGIVQRGHDVLLVQRRTRIRNLSWQFPAGIVKPGMDIRDKVENEVLQETGVKCRAEQYLGARVPETRVLCHYVHCRYLEGEAKNLDPEENAQAAWIHAGDVSEYVTSDIYIEVQHLLESIKTENSLEKVVLGIVLHQDRVLVIKKIANDEGLNWQFPGGLVEEQETEEAAVVREVHEETGIRCQPMKKIGERKHPTTHSIIAYWLCNYQSGEIHLTETEKISDIAWLERNHAVERLGSRLFSPVKKILESAGATGP